MIPHPPAIECVVVEHKELLKFYCAATSNAAIQIAIDSLVDFERLLAQPVPQSFTKLPDVSPIELPLTFHLPNSNGPHQFGPPTLSPSRSRSRSRNPWYRRQFRLPRKQPRSS